MLQSLTPRPDLLDRIAEVKLRAKRLSAIYVVSTMILAAIGAWVPLAILDYQLRPGSFGRWLLSVVWVGVMAAVGGLLLRRWRAARLTNRGVVDRIEHRYPQLRHRLRAAVDFLSVDESAAAEGASELKQLIIQQTRRDAEGLDFDAVLVRRPALLRAAVATCMLVLLALATFVRPQLVARSWQRLLLPLVNVSWPKQTDLVFHDLPGYAARGAPLWIQVVDRRGKLPAAVELEYRWLDRADELEAQGQIWSLAMARRDDAALALLPRVRQSVWLRAAGGDDQTPWHLVRAVPGHRIESARLTLHWPAYTGRAPSEVELDHLEILAGTRMTFELQVDRPLKEARWCFLPAGAARSETQRIALQVDDRRAWLDQDDAPTLDRPGHFWLELVDTKYGVTTSSLTWTATVAPDRPPELRWRGPAPSMVARQGTMELAFEVSEDVGVSDYMLRFQYADYEDDEPVDIAEGDWQLQTLEPRDPSAADPDAALMDVDSAARSRRAGPRSLVVHWSVPEDLPEWTERIHYTIQVRDLAGQFATAPMRRVQLVDALQLTRVWQDELARIVRRLREAEAMQRAAMQEAEMLRKGASTAENVDVARESGASAAKESQEANQQGAPPSEYVQAGMVQRWRSVLERQSEVYRIVTESPGGIQTLLEDATGWAGITKTPENEISRSVQQASRIIDQAASVDLPRLDQFLRQLVAGLADRLGQEGPGDQVVAMQRRVLGQLEAALQLLDAQYQYQMLLHELHDLHDEQEQLERELLRLQQQRLGQLGASGTSADWGPERQLEQRQRGMALQAERWGSRLAAASESQPLQNDPLQDRLRQTVRLWRQVAVPAAMRRAADQVRRGRLGNGLQEYDEIRSNLRALLRTLRAEMSAADVEVDPRQPPDVETGEATAESFDARLAIVTREQRQLNLRTSQTDAAQRPSLAAEQRAIHQALALLTADVAVSDVDKLALEYAQQSLLQAARLLAAADPSDRALALQRRALETLEELLQHTDEAPAPPDDASATHSTAPAADEQDATGPRTRAEGPDHATSARDLRLVLHLQRQLAAEVRDWVAEGGSSGGRTANADRALAERADRAVWLQQFQSRILELLTSAGNAADAGAQVGRSEDHSPASPLTPADIDQQLDQQLIPPHLRFDNSGE